MGLQRLRDVPLPSAAQSVVLAVLVLAMLAAPVAGAVPTFDSQSVAADTSGPAGVDGSPRYAVQPSNRTMNVSNVTVVGGAVVQTTPQTTFVWEAPQYNLSVTVNSSGYPESAFANLCVERTGGNATNTSSCTVFSPKPNGSRRVGLAYEKPVLGEQTLSITVRDWESNQTVARRNVSVTVIRKQDDFDDDLLSNEREVELGTNLAIGDTDRDGLEDGAEVDNYGTDPLESDTDGDGLLDAEEVNSGTNATLADTDGDGLDDGREANELRTNPTDPDTDGDGLDDGREVLKYDTSPTNSDTDGDGLSDGVEVDVYGTNPVRVDTDSDGLSDGTEVRLGTDPTNRWTSVGIVAMVVGALVVVAVGLDYLLRREMGATYGSWRRSLRAGLFGSDSADDDPDAADSVVADGAAPIQNSTGTEFKTDEDQIMELLYDHGGRIYQRELVDSTDWSASKVSRLLSSMEEDGLVEKISIGRENIVTVPDGSDAESDHDHPSGTRRRE